MNLLDRLKQLKAQGIEYEDELRVMERGLPLLLDVATGYLDNAKWRNEVEALPHGTSERWTAIFNRNEAMARLSNALAELTKEE